MLSKPPAYYLQESFRKCRGVKCQMLKNVFSYFTNSQFWETPTSPKDMLGYLRTSASQWKKNWVFNHHSQLHTLIEGQYVFSSYYLHFFAFEKMQLKVSSRKYFQICRIFVPFSRNKKAENRQYSIFRVYMYRNGICCATQTVNRTLEKHLSHLYQSNTSNLPVLLIHSATQCQVHRLCIRLASWPRPRPPWPWPWQHDADPRSQAPK